VYRFLNSGICFHSSGSGLSKKSLLNIQFLNNFADNSLKLFLMAYKISNECTACGSCIGECPVEAISEGDIYKIDASLCTDCGACADVCPVEAISPE
jgi:ferredoxin